jgi:hypothetical protein
MKRLLIPLAALLIGVILGWGASALASEGRQAYKSCIGEPYGTCQTMSRWCYDLKTQTHWRNIEDPEVRSMVHYFRIVCRSWGN